MTLAELRQALPDWKFVEVRRGGAVIGCFVVKGNEIHCWQDGTNAGRWITRQDLERLTKPLFALYGQIKTKVRKSNQAGQQFVTRMGFHQVGEDADCFHYECERLKHARL